MAKLDLTRDYYGDLGLPTTADISDVKKQFRKLALLYHPDRNPGKEEEANIKFQTIQAAHEVLTNAEQKSRYDVQRSRSANRYPTASGVRGNPWQDVASQYPMPPRRPGQAPTSASRNSAPSGSASASSSSAGANRYSGFSAPPQPKTSKEDYETRYQAWQNMRPNPKARPGQSASAAYAAGKAAGGASASPSSKASSSTANKPPMSSSMPPPPRTASQKQKADASFGARRGSGFAPRSPMGDEPPATNTSSYFTTRTHSTSYGYDAKDEKTQAAGRSRQGTNVDLSGNSDESILNCRKSTPYQTHSGEKINPYEMPAADMQRTKSQRSFSPQARPSPRRRSSSLPDDSDSTSKMGSQGVRRSNRESDTHTGGTDTGSPASTPTKANSGAARTGSRARPGAGPRRQFPASTSSTMPLFEQHYQRAMAEKESGTNAASSNNTSWSHTGTSAAAQAAAAAVKDRFGSSTSKDPPNGKSKPILYAAPNSQARPPNPVFLCAGQPPEDAAGSEHAGVQRDRAASRHGAKHGADVLRPHKLDPAFEAYRCSGLEACPSGHAFSKMKTSADPSTMTSLERKQLQILESLLCNVTVFSPDVGHSPQTAGREEQTERRRHQQESHMSQSQNTRDQQVSGGRYANPSMCSSPKFTLGDDAFETPSARTAPAEQWRPDQARRFMSNSAENINTRFVAEEQVNGQWQFSAGSSEAESSSTDLPSKARRSQSGSRIGRRSPGKDRAGSRTNSIPRPPPIPPRPPSAAFTADEHETSGTKDGEGASNATFDADKWSAKIGSEHFAPHSAQTPQAPQAPQAPQSSETPQASHIPQAAQTQEPHPSLVPRQPTPTQIPTRPIKKPKPVWSSREPVPVYDSEDSQDEGAKTRTGPDASAYQQQGPTEPTEPTKPAEPTEPTEEPGSPVAMDIDSPPAADWTAPPGPTAAAFGSMPSQAGFTFKTEVNGTTVPDIKITQAGGARNIPVEPSRPEWRPGDTQNATAGRPNTAAGAAPNTTAAGAYVGGSEDSEDFLASFADIKKVEPFNEGTSGILGGSGSGLESLGDLRSNLPFESKASNKMPLKKPRPRKAVTFPNQPPLPRPPAVLAVPDLKPTAGAWDKYVTEFRHYLMEWTEVNNQYVDHFQARRSEVEKQRREGGFAWLTARTDDGLREYLEWMSVDEDARRNWSAECAKHEQAVRRFKEFRDRMNS